MTKVDVENLRLCLRGSLLRADRKGFVEVPVDYIREALAVLPPSGLDVTREDLETPEMIGKMGQVRAINDLIKVAGIVHSKLASEEGQVTIIDQMALYEALKGLEPYLPLGVK